VRGAGESDANRHELVLSFAHWSFGFVSGFEFRVSDLQISAIPADFLPVVKDHVFSSFASVASFA